jgi:uncharacterized protein GlcG (DUF336 family)
LGFGGAPIITKNKTIFGAIGIHKGSRINDDIKVGRLITEDLIIQIL